MKKQNVAKRGITMMEVVIALVIITVVTAAVVTIMFVSVNIEAGTVTAIESANSAENAIECFRFAKNEEEFVEALNKTALYTSKTEGEYTSEGYGYTVTIIYHDTYFEYYAVAADGEEIYAFTFPQQNSTAGGGA